ncbi:hypothetical protein SAMN02745163_01439 [Clostridium cavendishii DSM 21758]|uniref:Tetratricopeptide repeat-containing protein n=1 Tax=Clostridium cavendishii DSM 21758 TaxID=1121302 RepID=A0A1M6GZW0_9CLOT|nr:hypothetical protein [Clostridium cavendishii]SHJ15434.1 hypothetical protein SAMN02745163_01439 [Clostridium cavendishii DSM 21758]
MFTAWSSSKLKKYKNLINYSLYTMFFVYIIYLILKEPNVLGKIPYFLILLIFGTLTFLNEYLKSLYTKSILLLTDSCNPKEGLKLIKLIERLDLFKSYKNSIIIFKLLALRDLGNIDELLKYANSLDIDHLHFNKDIILIYNYTLFMSYIDIKNDDKVLTYYKNLISIKKENNCPNLFSWSELNGIYHLYNNNLIESKKHFNKVKTNEMNTRERLHFFFNLSKLCIAQKEYDYSLKYLNNITSIENDLSINCEAQSILNSLYKNKKV